MGTPEGRPSVARRQLGRRLRALREDAGKTIEDVTTAARVVSRTKMWRIEHGRTVVKVGDVLALARLYRVDPPVIDDLVRLAEATRSSGYAEDLTGAAKEHFSLYAELEAGAAAVADYSSELVHGLLQTEDYIRAVLGGAGPPPADLDRRVAFRLRRQRAFFDRPEPGRVDAVLTAGALRVQAGSPLVMEAQREHLRRLGGRNGVSIRVLPFEEGPHAASFGPFTILDFDDPDDPSLVYVEDLVGSRYTDRPDHVAQFRAAFELARARAVPVQDYLG